MKVHFCDSNQDFLKLLKVQKQKCLSVKLNGPILKFHFEMNNICEQPNE